MPSIGFHLGIDTSNYRTSLAIVDNEGKVLADTRKYLIVKNGERGLRQQETLFQHVKNIPMLFPELIKEYELGSGEKYAPQKLLSVSVSTRPRPLETSYMPSFNAGYMSAASIANASSVPLYEFSHQEGHLAAASYNTFLNTNKPFVAFHFSGGTTEALLMPGYEICGGTKDISFGQLIDRVGVSLGMDFPCGAEMDKIACAGAKNSETIKITGIKTVSGYVNISGIETKCQSLVGKLPEEALVHEVFTAILRAIAKMTVQIASEKGISEFLYAGGVSSSLFIRDNLNKQINKYNKSHLTINTYFSNPKLSSDNAVGTALLGRAKYGNQSY